MTRQPHENRPDPALWWLLNKPMYAACAHDQRPRTWGEAWANRNSYTEQFLRRAYLREHGHEIDKPPAGSQNSPNSQTPDASHMIDPDF